MYEVFASVGAVYQGLYKWIEGTCVETSTREIDSANPRSEDRMTTDLDESLQAVLGIEEGNFGEVAFAKNLCGSCVDALGFAGKAQSNDIFLLQTRVIADLVD